MAYDRAGDLDVFRLEFAEYPGLELRAFRPSFIGEDAIEAGWPVLLNPQAGRVPQKKALRLLAEALAGAVVDWDLQWLGRPVPPTLPGLLGLDTQFLLTLVSAWVEQVALRPAEVDDDEAELSDEQDPADALSEIPMLPVPDPIPTDHAELANDAERAEVDGAPEVDAEPDEAVSA